MLTNFLSNPVIALIFFLGLAVSIAIHEFAHAYMADRLGDPTPRLMGRLTLNPLAHLDPLGTILIFLIGFGWGKPVVFDPFNLKSPRRDAALISIAGPITNFLMAIACAIIFRILVLSPSFQLLLALDILTVFIRLNLILGGFNLIPVHPLDGFKIVSGFLPAEKSREWDELAKYGIFFLILLLMPLPGGGSVLGNILQPIVSFLFRILLP